jgi:hypothetical protein
VLFGIHGIEESTVYQGILRKGKAIGRIDDARTILLRHGGKKLGPPSQRIEAEITALCDVDRLHDLIDRVLDVSTWDELMASPDQQGVASMLSGTGGIAESSVHERIRRRGKALGLAEAYAEGYVGVYAEVYADVFAKGYAEGFAEGYTEEYAECRINQARTTLLRLGAKKLGLSGERIEAEIATMRDVDRLNDLSDRVDDVSTWDDLLAPPGPPS